jgi:hypothetical protein
MGRDWPAAPLGAAMFSATVAGGVALHVLEERAPLRVGRRVREIGRQPARQIPSDSDPLDEVLAVGSITLLNEASAPLRTLLLHAAPDGVEETAPTAVPERDAAGARWLRWELDVPPREPVTLEFRYRAWVKPEAVKPRPAASP